MSVFETHLGGLQHLAVDVLEVKGHSDLLRV